MTLLADSRDTGGRLTSYRSTFAEGAIGAPAHLHTKASELFYVIDGALRVLVGERFDNHCVDSPVWREALAARA
ncbi:cupin domain-containing protein [Streptomyces hawaiiensis]|uniref:cupin domain-containing protein n=1 Tax=Streptomyces hawaiiensis TaxID=67305 RepID=UPI00365ADE3D